MSLKIRVYRFNFTNYPPSINSKMFEDIWRKKKEENVKTRGTRGSAWKIRENSQEEKRERTLVEIINFTPSINSTVFEDVWRCLKKGKGRKCKNTFYRGTRGSAWKIRKNSREGKRKDTRRNYCFNFTIYPPSINSCLKMFKERKRRKYKNAFYRGSAWKIRENSRKKERKRGKDTRQNYRFNFTIYPPSINSTMFEDVWRKKKEKKCILSHVEARVCPWKICENSRGGGRTHWQGQPVYVHHITQGINREYAHVCG